MQETIKSITKNTNLPTNTKELEKPQLTPIISPQQLNEDQLLSIIPIHPLLLAHQKRNNYPKNPLTNCLYMNNPNLPAKNTFYHGLKQYLFLTTLYLVFFLEFVFDSHYGIFLLVSLTLKLIVEHFFE
jgi:hypothetical protein